MKKNRYMIFLSILLALNLIFTAGLSVCFMREKTAVQEGFPGSEQIQKYTLYIGTNDKDTGTQLISTEDAHRIVGEICEKYVSVYTVTEAQGNWISEGGMRHRENTLIYSFNDADDAQIQSIMDEVLIALNQESILAETEWTDSVFYTGRKSD